MFMLLFDASLVNDGSDRLPLAYRSECFVDFGERFRVCHERRKPNLAVHCVLDHAGSSRAALAGKSIRIRRVAPARASASICPFARRARAQEPAMILRLLGRLS
ncbi:hypothetical protein [Burkholderia sp. B21-007]|uniref:hypothetical protein n=1 Tax=unclassified Burkholderia TaxID=2613784 RepID=UPI003A5D01B9